MSNNRIVVLWNACQTDEIERETGNRQTALSVKTVICVAHHTVRTRV